MKARSESGICGPSARATIRPPGHSVETPTVTDAPSALRIRWRANGELKATSITSRLPPGSLIVPTSCSTILPSPVSTPRSCSRTASTWVRDLGSTNGIYVNGVRDRKARIPAGRHDHGRQHTDRARRQSAPRPLRRARLTTAWFGPLLGKSLEMREPLPRLSRVATADASGARPGGDRHGQGAGARAIHERGATVEGGPSWSSTAAPSRPACLSPSSSVSARRVHGGRARPRGASRTPSGGTIFLDEIGELPLDGAAEAAPSARRHGPSRRRDEARERRRALVAPPTAARREVTAKRSARTSTFASPSSPSAFRSLTRTPGRHPAARRAASRSRPRRPHGAQHLGDASAHFAGAPLRHGPATCASSGTSSPLRRECRRLPRDRGAPLRGAAADRRGGAAHRRRRNLGLAARRAWREAWSTT